MKKNRMMRLASILLVCVLLTTSVISGTFAKYTTNKTGSDTARVAKFGVEITANGTMFAKTYKYDDTVVAEAGDETSVSAGTNVVAPGTEGTMATMTLAGTPEVDVLVEYEATVTINDKWVADGNNYFPLVIKVDDTAVSYNSSDDADTIAAAIKAAIEDHTEEYKAGTNLATKGADSVTVTWEWPYEGDDAKDTALGDAADAGTITIAIKTIVTQVD